MSSNDLDKTLPRPPAKKDPPIEQEKPIREPGKPAKKRDPNRNPHKKT